MILVYRILLAALSGGMLGLTVPPFDIKILAWIALVPLLVSINKTKWQKAFLLGILTGLLYFGVGGYWLAVYNTTAFVISWLVTSSFIGLFCIGVRVLQEWLNWRKWNILLPPLVWISLAYLFSLTPIESYWSHIGEPQPLYVLQIIAITGVAGLTSLIVAANSIISWYITHRHERDVAFIAGSILAAVVLVSLVYGITVLQKDRTGELSVAVVQPNFPQPMKWRVEHLDEIFEKYEKLILEAREAKLIVLPLYTLPVNVQTTVRKLGDLARITDSYVTVATYKGDVNIALLFSDKGNFLGEYAAVHKPPFRNQTPGFDYTVFDTGIGKVGMFLCYDGVGEKTIREFIRNGAQVLVSMANDNDFLGTEELQLHLDQDILRAVENRRYIVRAAPSGISAIIDPYGQVLNKSEIGKEQVIFGKVKLLDEKTPFTKSGDILSPLASVLLLLLTAGATIKKNACIIK